MYRKFEAVVIAPASLIKASSFCCGFMALNATHTKSKYRMMLLIATTIDANDNLLPLAWALVPTENVEWWTWFMKFVKEHFLWANSEHMVSINDRDKGIASAINTNFPNGNQAHCCQHIADNVQSKFGLTCQNQFWKVARAKDRRGFKVSYLICTKLSCVIYPKLLCIIYLSYRASFVLSYRASFVLSYHVNLHLIGAMENNGGPQL